MMTLQQARIETGTTLRELMSSDVVTLAPEATVPETAACMLRAGIHRVVVMEGARLLGVVSATDALRSIAPEANR
jgi:CBS domain-containing protein